MRKVSLIIFVSVAFLSCQPEKQKQTSAENKKVQMAAKEPVPNEDKVLLLPWTAVYDSETDKMVLKHNPESKPENLNLQDMLDALNLKYPRVVLIHESTTGDTLNVAIDNADFLTQQMGSAGATSYFAEATFALTELKGIKAVNFSFKEGDHATPKTYSRKDFSDFN